MSVLTLCSCWYWFLLDTTRHWLVGTCPPHHTLLIAPLTWSLSWAHSRQWSPACRSCWLPENIYVANGDDSRNLAIEKMLKMFLSCCCMKEKKKKKKYEDTNVQKVFDESVISHKSPSPKVLTPKAQTSKVPKTCSASDIVFTSSSPIFTLHRAKLPAISTSSEEFCFYQVCSSHV